MVILTFYVQLTSAF